MSKHSHTCVYSEMRYEHFDKLKLNNLPSFYMSDFMTQELFPVGRTTQFLEQTVRKKLLTPLLMAFEI